MYSGLDEIDRRVSGASQEIYVDLDEDGRRMAWDMTMDLDTQRRQEALSKLGAISRRRSAVLAGDYVAPDLCGRGDPRIFAEIFRRVSLVEDNRLQGHDLEAIACAQGENISQQQTSEHDDRQKIRSPLRRTISISFRKSRFAYYGVRKLFGFTRPGDKSSSA